jgi:hypothetical protein
MRSFVAAQAVAMFAAARAAGIVPRVRPSDKHRSEAEMKLERRSEMEATVRAKVAFICLAARFGTEGELRALTNDLIDWLKAREHPANVDSNDIERR